MSKTKNINDVIKSLSSKYKDGLYVGKDIHRKGRISTGSLNLDDALKGGYVRGKIVECYGAESTGKTTLGFAMLASSSDELCGFIDGESSYEAETAELYGVNTSNLIVQRPPYIEAGMEMVLDMIDEGCKAIMFDSIAGIPTKTELEHNMEDHNVGKKASRMGQLMRKLHLKADEAGCVVFFINQIRDSMSMFGSPFVTPGGHALKFHASYRLWITSAKKITVRDELVGHEMNMRIVKHKFGPPNINVPVPLVYGTGIAKEWEIMKKALNEGVLTKSGTWVKYGDDNIAQGDWNTYTMLKNNPDILEEIMTALMVKDKVQ